MMACWPISIASSACAPFQQTPLLCSPPQPSFELGVLAHEVSCGGRHPIEGYPSVLEWTATDVGPCPDTYPPTFRELVVAMLTCDPSDRPALEEVVCALRHLRREAGVPDAHRLLGRLDRPKLRDVPGSDAKGSASTGLAGVVRSALCCSEASPRLHFVGCAH